MRLKKPEYKVGDRVKVRRAGNALGNHKSATITIVNERLLHEGSSFFAAEKHIALALILRGLTLGYLPPHRYTYDVQYKDDESEEEKVMPEFIITQE